jgi:ABC-type lipoprotein release transport system permease subunit
VDSPFRSILHAGTGSAGACRSRILISLLAAWWPARKAVNLNVVEAIGYE